MSTAAISTVLRGQEQLLLCVLPRGDADRAPGHELQTWPLEGLNLPVLQRAQTPSAPS
jgi:hypothetical protein